MGDDTLWRTRLMLLALSIVSEQGAALGPSAYKVFDERGGTIGRIAANDWVLPDPQNFVSSRHALVIARGGMFYLEDKSSNGTFINAADQPTSRPEPQPLQDGDRLYIGDYEIIVQLIPSAPDEIVAKTPAAPVEAPTILKSRGTPPLQAVPAEPVPSALGLGTVDPLAALVAGPASGGTLAPDSADHQLFESVVRLAVQGLVDVLRSRTQVKNSFRLPTTSIKPVENNPLKFAPTAEDAFHKLFIKRGPGDLQPLDAFREGFDDVTFHQTAVLAGIRAGFNSVLAALHPDKLEEVFERKRKRTAVLPLGNKTKFWEMYREQFEEIDHDREAHFQMLFGEAFALAYNEHLQKLSAEARLRRQR
jgi:predicted component of type VI protein secretion system